jgi:peptidyl-prolyl cis-trans isomerase D
MLDILRANARSALTYVLFGIIIVVFVVSFGPGSCGGTGAPSAPIAGEEAAEVNGERITAAELEQHYGQLYRAYQAQAGEAFSRELAETLGLRRVAMDQLVERELVRQEARRQGVAISDHDLEREIVENPAFHVNGQFDRDAYVRAVTNAYGTPARFEERLREDLVVQRMLALLRQTAKVSDDEVKEAWRAQADRANVAFVRFPLAAARAEAKVTDAEAAAFAKANPDRVKKAYEENKARYDQPRRARASHVLVKVDAAAPAAEVDAARKKADEIAARARKGEDFAKLARELSQDPSAKENGGDLGLFGPGVMAKEFEEAVFAARAGEVVGPVRTPFGLHVIKVAELQEPKVVPLEAAQVEVAKGLLADERAQELARRKAKEALAALQAGKPLADLFPSDAKRQVTFGGQPLQVEETGPFTAGAVSVPRLGSAPELAKAAFAAEGPRLLEQVFETGAGPVVARVKERQRPDAADFEAKKAEVAASLRARREAELERAWVQSLREKGSVKVNEKLAGGRGLASAGG